MAISEVLEKNWLVPYSHHNVSCPKNDVGHPRLTDNGIAEKWRTPPQDRLSFGVNPVLDQKVLRCSLLSE